MTSVLLIYPYFKPRRDRSVFRFPPLGISYVAARLQQAGHSVRLIDCTFLDRERAISMARSAKADVVGIYCMATLLKDCLWFASEMRSHCSLLVAGGPLPTCDPPAFLGHFDVVVRGEGEETMVELLQAHEAGRELRQVRGITFREKEVISTAERPMARDLDAIPFPARGLLPNESYIRFGKEKQGYSTTTILSTRGCPFVCDFCSNVVFGGSYRARSPEKVVDEIEEVLSLGYDRVSFSDDVFTFKRARLIRICEEIRRRSLHFKWDCLARVDAMDFEMAGEMRDAGCTKIYFGIESGNEDMLKLMKKEITLDQARNAVESAHRAGLEVGAFFILGYPGDTDDTVLETLRFATSLPIDYLGLTMPYPLPGTGLYERVRHRISRDWRPGSGFFGSQSLVFNSDFSRAKMWFGILKGHVQFKIRKKTGRLAPLLMKIFEKPTDALFRLLK